MDGVQICNYRSLSSDSISDLLGGNEGVDDVLGLIHVYKIIYLSNENYFDKNLSWYLETKYGISDDNIKGVFARVMLDDAIDERDEPGWYVERSEKDVLEQIELVKRAMTLCEKQVGLVQGRYQPRHIGQMLLKFILLARGRRRLDMLETPTVPVRYLMITKK